jgi:hypothetical protein
MTSAIDRFNERFRQARAAREQRFAELGQLAREKRFIGHAALSQHPERLNGFAFTSAPSPQAEAPAPAARPQAAAAPRPAAPPSAAAFRPPLPTDDEKAAALASQVMRAHRAVNLGEPELLAEFAVRPRAEDAEVARIAARAVSLYREMSAPDFRTLEPAESEDAGASRLARQAIDLWKKENP